tara:strand:+ start:1412 stop:1588 length:177 start_codon:yes stop_codon:yes gene_type:complete
MLGKIYKYSFYFGIPTNLWVLWVAFSVKDPGMQLLAIANMILLSFGFLYAPGTEKQDK